jgi:serine/threonine protein kinase
LRRVIGEVVGGCYALEERLGSGGSSSVWRARDQRTGREVAIKLLHLDAAESPETIARFDREARVLEGIASPNTVELLDRGDMDGRPYLVFELIDGTDLRERLRQDGMIGIADAVAIATQVANGLAAAHSRRCVHRDLKPGNILISDDGRVCVADFGIARALEEPGLTQPGRVLGTGEYVSPEQALGRKVDARSDLYALGVVLYEMLAGRPPFRGSGFADVAARHVRDEPPPISDARPNLPAGLSALVAALLAKAPEERPQDAATVRSGLRQILRPLAGPDPSPLVATALRETDDAEPATGEYHVLEHGPSHLGELAPWEDVTPSSMNFDHGGPIHLESAPYRVPASARENAGALRWAAVLALGVAVGVIALLLALTGGGSNTTTTTAANTAPATTATTATAAAGTATEAASGTTSTVPVATPLEVQTALTFDPPPGDGSENDDQAQQAIDGDAATFWETETYRSDPVLSKGGVGLVLAFAQRQQVAAVDLRTPGPGFTAAVYTSSLPAPPAALAGWDVAATPRDVSKTRQRIDFAKPARARFVLVWISRLAPAEGAGFSARIAEAQPLGS